MIRVASYWRTCIEIWLFRQKPLFFVRNACIACIGERNCTVAIFVGSEKDPLQWCIKLEVFIKTDQI